MKRVLYHYTNAAGYEGILSSKTINPSLKANNPKDARFGDGQYLSDIIPGTKRPGQLSMIFFNIPWAGHRFTHHIDINVEGLDVILGREHVHLIPNSSPLDISKRLVGSGRN
ncbi:HYD1 signature containing ADP-ribosyltransferase family protein [Endozoicomonas arenosclerae]|uniref:HYD1 signature containing ADP-ribosyltransferase family protein n=1 Tax=Endozoicomonas arenosclerae TaxID=1633495 RepID=UPI000783A686|nr:HYD1 signature containing ADP-ribosyltransferase family protein [Endozoicomonas arenosclerae]